MPQATYEFPHGFLWGTATAAHQVEGRNTNNTWHDWENQPGRIKDGHRSGLAGDWWGGRWQEDLDRALADGQNAHRLSVEWSRIQPSPGSWDQKAIDQYLRMVRGINQRGMTPMVTLHHFSDPLWLMEMGGWEHEDTPALFNDFSRKIVEALKDEVNLWCTINEPNVYIFGAYVDGSFPPGKQNMDTAFAVLCNLARGHAAAYHTIHEIQPHARVGIAHHYRSFKAARSWLPLDKLVADSLSKIFNSAFPNVLADGTLNFIYTKEKIPEAVNTQDFFGLNYYTRDMVKFTLSPGGFLSKRFLPKDAELSGTGFIANVPEGLSEAIKWANGYGLPIMITENGVEEPDDKLRPRYIAEHLHQVWRMLNHNYPVQGYFYWTLTDNFEWERGWTQRFGLWKLDETTQERIRRPCADLYAAICKENAISHDTIQKFAPKALAKLFPE
jgi:beta-glucosidase